MGAILGAKKLKAIAVRGERGVAIAEPDKFMECCLRANASIRNDPSYKEFGNPADFMVFLSSVGYYNQGNLDGVRAPFDLADLKEFIGQYKIRRKGVMHVRSIVNLS